MEGSVLIRRECRTSSELLESKGIKILVTGGALYQGSTLVPDLLSVDHEVKVLDKFMFKHSSLNHDCYLPKFSVLKGDIRLVFF